MEFKLPQMPVGTKQFCLGALAGAALIAWIGFDALGWKLNSAAEALANRKAEAAVVSAFASICRDQFAKGADYSARLSALDKVERYSRGDAVAKAGWATMNGAKEPRSGVAQECAELLIPAKSL
jgi:hypothetical protein